MFAVGVDRRVCPASMAASLQSDQGGHRPRAPGPPHNNASDSIAASNESVQMDMEPVPANGRRPGPGSFQAAEGDAFDELFLEEEEDQQEREGRHVRGGQDDRVVREVLALEERDPDR